MVVVSVIVPFFNERAEIQQQLAYWELWHRLPGVELLFVDGQSDDGGDALLRACGFQVLVSNKGRACQMNFGAGQARGDILWFIHLDTVIADIDKALFKIRLVHQESQAKLYWGFSTVELYFNENAASNWLELMYFKCVFGCIQWFMNMRSTLTSIATGDQCQFFSKTAFDLMNGFPDQHLLEDVQISKHAKKRIGRPVVFLFKAKTSARRWLTHGIWTTIFCMWSIRFQYWQGVCSSVLAKRYK